jgi:hypothetical protein
MSLRKFFTMAGLLLLTMWVLVGLALIIYTSDSRQTVNDYVIDIAEGSSVLIAAGQNPLDIDVAWDTFVGDSITLANDDIVAHTFGPWTVAAGSTDLHILTNSLTRSYACSLHPSGAISLNVQPRSFDFGLTVKPALMLGIPTALVFTFGQLLREALEEKKDEDEIVADGSPEPALDT